MFLCNLLHDCILGSRTRIRIDLTTADLMKKGEIPAYFGTRFIDRAAHPFLPEYARQRLLEHEEPVDFLRQLISSELIGIPRVMGNPLDVDHGKRYARGIRAAMTTSLALQIMLEFALVDEFTIHCLIQLVLRD